MRNFLMIDRSDLHNLFLLGYALLETLNVHSRILSTSLYFLLVYIIINFVQKRWAHVQSGWVYPDFVAEFDRLTPEDVVWEPYSELAITTCAPFEISSVYFQDQAFWMTTAALVTTFTLRLTARTESGESSVKGSCILCRQH